ncbi:MAG: hypothetical protein OHK0017_05930 [Patescibacteria group bacterium]
MFALEDLYSGGSNGSKPVVVAPAPAASSGGLNNIFSIPTYFSGWINFVHGWFLAFTIFYSLFFFLDFLFWRVQFHEGSVENEEQGMDAIWNCWKMWRGYLIFVGFWLISFLVSGWLKYIFEFAALVSFFVGFVVVDLTIIPVIKNFFGFPGLSIQNIWKGIQDVMVGVIQELWAIVTSLFSGGAAPAPAEKKK